MFWSLFARNLFSGELTQLYMHLYHSITQQYLSVTNESSLEPLHVCLCSLVNQVRNTWFIKIVCFSLHLNLKYLHINRFPYRFNVAFLQNSHLDSDICKSNFSLKETRTQLSFGAFHFVHTTMIHVKCHGPQMISEWHIHHKSTITGK